MLYPHGCAGDVKNHPSIPSPPSHTHTPSADAHVQAAEPGSVVTRRNVANAIGARVVRGPAWKWGGQVSTCWPLDNAPGQRRTCARMPKHHVPPNPHPLTFTKTPVYERAWHRVVLALALLALMALLANG